MQDRWIVLEGFLILISSSVPIPIAVVNVDGFFQISPSILFVIIPNIEQMGNVWIFYLRSVDFVLWY